MSISIMSKVFYTDFPVMPSRSIRIKDSDQLRLVNISPSVSKIIMLAISDNADDSGENSWNSLDTLAKKTNLNRRTVVRAINVLEEYGYLTVKNLSTFGTNNIKIHIDKLGDTPHKRPKAGRPKNEEIKTSGSESETSGSESETSGSEPPESSLSIHNHTLQNILQTDTSTPAKKNGGNMNSEEYKEKIKESLFVSLQSTQIGYANFPEEIRPVVERMDKQWRFGVPVRSKKKGGEFALWIESCRELLDACGEYGVTLLDEMRAVWEEGVDTHEGTVAFVPNGPRGLVKTMRGFAAAKRRGEKYAFNYPREYKKEVHQSMMDV